MSTRARRGRGRSGLLRAPHQRIGWQPRVEHLARAVGAADREPLWVDQPQLCEDRGLIPVDVLMGELAVAEMHDDDQRHLDPSAGRCYPRQHPVDLDSVGEFEDHLVNELIGPDCP